MKYILFIRGPRDGMECPYCIKAQEFLNERNLDYKSVVFDKEQENLLQEIKNVYDWDTVPMIFSKEGRSINFIGGYDDLISLFNTDER